MTLTGRITALAELTLRDPRQAVSDLLAEAVPLQARVLGLVLVSVLAAALSSIQIGVQAVSVDPLIVALTANPLRAAVLQSVSLGLTVLMIHGIGRAFGGRGNLPDALLIVVWLQFLMLGAQLLQLVTELLSPALAGVVALLSLGLFLWLMTSFIAALHGFRSLGLVFIGLIASALGFGFVIVVAVVAMLGPEVFLLDV